MFGRRNKKRQQDDATGDAEAVASPSPVTETGKSEDQYRVQGPWDVTEDAPDIDRLDLGAIRVPVEKGIEVQVNIAQKRKKIIGVTLIKGNSALQVQPFAAPKSSGLWDEMREELREQVTEQGGKAEDFEGAFGPELRAVVPVEGKTNESGQQLGQRVRFIGVDGPRWVLRGVIRGEGATKPEVMAEIEEIFQRIVVVRGEQPVPPRDLLSITVPPELEERMTESANAQHPQQAAGDGTAG
ncbi:hypothetical protein F4561_003019 [Lipingzhangella halophila]|uniref:DUF3710 domain-containing protein n=1 Tax=Lipingzhangella halophila TaxID=1783352 RepID=A0A7W7RHQ2_9ACTN|nr:DUF3710 domain-containing protein [Lipingzhangella halophila]MBB4932199.1 hypothetical protein [Lipingzhangella halophila]